jgi:thiol-disulfide isomerase/thioredoxin
MVWRCFLLGVVVAGALEAAVGVGATRDEVIAALGAPRGTSQAGRREILTYPDGRVVLDEGRVTSVDFKRAKPSAPSAPPAPVAPPPTPAPAPAVPVPADPWLVDLEAAKRLAAAQKKRLLVLFTGTDWCPPCQAFQNEVAGNADFLGLAQTSFVLVKVDWLRNRPQPAEEAARVAALRRQYGIASYPTLVVLAADGTLLMRVDTRKGRPADSLADFYVQAVDEARQATRDGKPVSSSWWPF